MISDETISKVETKIDSLIETQMADNKKDLSLTIKSYTDMLHDLLYIRHTEFAIKQIEREVNKPDNK